MDNSRQEKSQGDEESAAARERLVQEALGYDYVRLTMVDLMGIGRSRLLTKHAVQDACRHGVAMGYSANVMGTRTEIEVCLRISKLGERAFGNGVLRPVPGTLHALPYGPSGCTMGEVLCELCWEDGRPLASDPRHLAGVQLERLAAMGYKIYSSFETEVVVVDPKDNQPPSQMDFRCFTNLDMIENADWLVEVELTLSKMGVLLQTIDIEMLAKQFEFNPFPQMGIQAADEGFLLKQTLKELCSLRHLEATFMAKPFPDVPSYSTGIHYNHSLWSLDGSTNVFWEDANKATEKSSDPNLRGVENMSSVARHWLAGLLTHARALVAIYSPTVNCYRRSCPEPEKPGKFNWGMDNRLTSFRVKTLSHKGTYIENRLPSGACNPYLVMAATVAAGIDGIVNRLELPEPEATASAVVLADMLGGAKSESTEKIESTNQEATNLEDKEVNTAKNTSVDDISLQRECKDQATSDNANVEQKTKNTAQSTTQNVGNSEEEKLHNNVQPSDLGSALECLKQDAVLVQALGEEFIEWFVVQRQVECEKFPDWNKNRNNPETFQAEKERFYRYL